MIKVSVKLPVNQIIMNKKVLGHLEQNWKEYKQLDRNLRAFSVKFHL